MRWAIMKGLWFGIQETPVPSTMFLVMGMAVAMNKSGAGMFSHAAVKCSPIQAFRSEGVVVRHTGDAGAEHDVPGHGDGRGNEQVRGRNVLPRRGKMLPDPGLPI